MGRIQFKILITGFAMSSFAACGGGEGSGGLNGLSPFNPNSAATQFAQANGLNGTYAYSNAACGQENAQTKGNSQIEFNITGDRLTILSSTPPCTSATATYQITVLQGGPSPNPMALSAGFNSMNSAATTCNLVGIIGSKQLDQQFIISGKTVEVTDNSGCAVYIKQ